MRTSATLIALSTLVILGTYFVWQPKLMPKIIKTNDNQVLPVKYISTEYGFNFTLPSTWSGYSVFNGNWTGNMLEATDGQKIIGPEIIIRHPLWTVESFRQDIPIMIFTFNQWDLILQGRLFLGAAPINPSELGRNTKYVFALPARYNFAFPTGFEEVSKIINSKPLQGIELTPASSSPISSVATVFSSPAVPVFRYIQIIDGCGPYFDVGTCVNMRSGPDVSYPVVGRLRNGVVLKVETTTTVDESGREWYKIILDKYIRYPERVETAWYVAVNPEAIRPFEDPGDSELKKLEPNNGTKYIIVNLKNETLSAYDGQDLFMQESVSTGLYSTPTQLGNFVIFKKTPSRYMQGPIPGFSDQVYDLPGVPWNLYFTTDGVVIHGAYWHDHFGQPWSHGCINMSPEKAKELYNWADLGTSVTVIY